jgi:hypothetical protein
MKRGHASCPCHIEQFNFFQVEVLVKRASGLHPLSTDAFPVLSADKVNQIMECLFQATAYIYPESIALPADYSPPSMAIATAYWKVQRFNI